jgi:HTH-type transcriptional regulator/antitoxin HigA
MVGIPALLSMTSWDPARMERLANAAAEQFLVPPGAIDEFLDRVGLQITKGGLVKFALSLQVHPGIVVGQLQRRLQRWDLFRPLQGKIRDAVTAAALTDGYGHLVA